MHEPDAWLRIADASAKAGVHATIWLLGILAVLWWLGVLP